MPVLLTQEEEFETWLTGSAEEAFALAREYPVGRKNEIRDIMRRADRQMEASKDRYCDDLCSLGVVMPRKWHRRAGRTLSNRTVWAPARQSRWPEAI